MSKSRFPTGVEENPQNRYISDGKLFVAQNGCCCCINPSRHHSDANRTLRNACVGEWLKCDRVYGRLKLKFCVRDKTKKETEIPHCKKRKLKFFERSSIISHYLFRLKHEGICRA